MNNRRISDNANYQYGDSGMVPTHDHFLDKLQDKNESMTGMENGGTNTAMSMWSIGMLFTAISLIFVVWCLYASYCAMTSSQVSQTSSSNQQNQNENNGPISRTKRKNLILDYFATSGNQMEVKAVDLLYLTDDAGSVDIENRTVASTDHQVNDHHQLLNTAQSIVADNGLDSIVVLLVDRTKIPLAPESDYQPAPDDEELGISSSSESEPQQVRHEAFSSVSSTPQSQDKDGVPLEFSISCTDSNHLKHVSTTSSPLHTSKLQWVYDNCAICLEPYQEGDVVVWSCTESCPHVFHKTCFVDYLLSYRGPGTPCPSCRQPFIDECVCNACKNRPKRTASAEVSSQILIANESTIEYVNNSTTSTSNQDDGMVTT